MELGGLLQLVRTDLSNADFSHADLRGLVLIDCDLSGADFTGANLVGVVARGNDWSDVTFTESTRCFDGRRASDRAPRLRALRRSMRGRPRRLLPAGHGLRAGPALRVQECASNGECGPGNTCYWGTCAQSFLGDPECVFDVDCGPGRRCERQRCEAP